MQDDPGTGAAAGPVERRDDHFMERHAAFLRRIREGPVGLLFIGDSITRRWAEVPHLWARYFARYAAANFGVGSDTTQSCLWRLLHGELDGIDPRGVVLLIGTNDLPTRPAGDVAGSIHSIVDVVHDRLPNAVVILMAVFPRGPQREPHPPASEPSYARPIKALNDELSREAARGYVHLLDIGARMLGPDGEIDAALMADRLHLVEPGYVTWAEALEPLLRSIFGE